jgi:hypothetical protein
LVDQNRYSVPIDQQQENIMTVPRNEDFNQVCVWPGTIVKEDEIPDFVAFMQAELGARVQFLETVLTKADPGDDTTGGRQDVVFAVHKDDVHKFAVPRLRLGIRWVEDVLDNEKHHNEMAGYPGYSIYPDTFAEYRTW